MAGIHHFSGSFIQSGSTAKFKSGINVTGNINVVTGAVSGTFIGDGSGLTLPGQSGITLFIGSASNHIPPTFGNWIIGEDGTDQTIILATSASNGNFNHFTFLRNDRYTNNWIEVSDYSGEQNGLASSNTIIETLGTGIYRYLLIAASSESRKTVTAETVAIINPDHL